MKESKANNYGLNSIIYIECTDDSYARLQKDAYTDLKNFYKDFDKVRIYRKNEVRLIKSNVVQDIESVRQRVYDYINELEASYNDLSHDFSEAKKAYFDSLYRRVLRKYEKLKKKITYCIKIFSGKLRRADLRKSFRRKVSLIFKNLDDVPDFFLVGTTHNV